MLRPCVSVESPTDLIADLLASLARRGPRGRAVAVPEPTSRRPCSTTPAPPPPPLARPGRSASRPVGPSQELVDQLLLPYSQGNTGVSTVPPWALRMVTTTRSASMNDVDIHQCVGSLDIGEVRSFPVIKGWHSKLRPDWMP
jgi:hypothetical protein